MQVLFVYTFAKYCEYYENIYLIHIQIFILNLGDAKLNVNVT